MTRRPIFAANWKMNRSLADIAPFVQGLSDRVSDGGDAEVVVAPPATHLPHFAAECDGLPIQIACQNPGPAASGAFTGEISPTLLKEIGVSYALIGHSERRHVFHEEDGLLSQRLSATFAAGLTAIFCVGETLEERRTGHTLSIVEGQLSLLAPYASSSARCVVAYEPVWAIGTGENATPEQAEEVHVGIRGWLSRNGFASQVPILYGGSVKSENSESLMVRPEVDGLLVGGASLEVASFAAIIQHGLAGWQKKVSSGKGL